MAQEKEPHRLLNICLITSDAALTDMCRTALEQLCPGEYQLRQCATNESPASADIYIWDFVSRPDLPATACRQEGATKLIIAPRTSLATLRTSLPENEFVFLHSPVTRLTLRVFLESALARLDSGSDLGGPRVALDRDRIFQKLLETNLKLQDYDQDRTNFLARAVHDIRVPLTALHGYCGLLLAGEVGRINAEQARILEKMQRSLTRLGGLTAAMTDLGAGPRTAASRSLESGNLEDCIGQAVHEIRPFAEQKQITLKPNLEPAAGTLLFDPGELEQVLVNLLDNACKFTPRRGSVEIHGYSVETSGHHNGNGPHETSGYRIDVSDTGPGIRPEHIERIFDEYTSYRGPEDRSGTGLGLAICRMIVQAHNGRIWATSEEYGAKFSLVLPYIETHTERPVA